MTGPETPETEAETQHAVFARELVGTRVAGRYIVEEVLGQGGMGCVVAATYPELEQRVAVKFMWPELCANTSLATRFVREARLAAKITSPHLVRVFDVGRLDNGTPYLVMERLDGNDLGQEVDTKGFLAFDVIVDFALQTLQGLAEIHARHVVHRDLKPANLFLAREGGGRIVKLLDFGISKENQANKPASGLTTESILGTPHYMAPEQVKDSRDVDARTDIWSMGVILYELFTGKMPFSGDATSFGEVFGRILFTDPAAPRTHRPELPEALEAIVMECLKRERSERFADVGELAIALAPFGRPEIRHRADGVARVLATDAPLATASEPNLGLRATDPGFTPAEPAPSPPVSAERVLASSTQSSWDHARPKAPGNKRALLAVIAVGGVAIGIIAIAFLRGPKKEEPARSTTTLVASPPPSASAIPLAESAATPTPSITPTASVAATASASAKKIPTTPTKPPPTTTKPPDLVLDRK